MKLEKTSKQKKIFFTGKRLWAIFSITASVSCVTGLLLVLGAVGSFDLEVETTATYVSLVIGLVLLVISAGLFKFMYDIVNKE